MTTETKRKGQPGVWLLDSSLACAREEAAMSSKIERIITAKAQALMLESLPACFQFGELIPLIGYNQTHLH